MAHVNRQLSSSTSTSVMQSPSLTKTLTLIFQMEAWTKPGHSIWLIGDKAELGGWEGKKAVKLVPGEAYSIWATSPVTFETGESTITIAYQYITVTDNDECEELTPVRSFTAKLDLVDSLKYTVKSSLTGPEEETIDTLEECSIFRGLRLEEPFGHQLEELGRYLEEKTGEMTLKRLLSLLVYFKQISETQKEAPDFREAGICDRLMAITRLLCAHMTEEIRPLIGKIVLLMGKCCPDYKETMKNITNVHLFQHKKVEFGCGSEAVEGLLDELFGTSPRDGLGMLRVIVLNSIRKGLRGLISQSTRPELLLMYDVWISVLQRSYIESLFLTSDPTNIPNLLHQVSILAEYSQLGGVCGEIVSLAEGIQDNSDLMTTRTVLVQMILTIKWWIARYIEGAKTIQNEDFLGLKQTLVCIGTESVEMLLPITYKALFAVSHSIGTTFSLGLCLGTAAGRVLFMPDFDEVPYDHIAILAIVKPKKALSTSIPQQVKGIVQVGSSYLCSHLLSHCLQHSIPFGLITREWRDKADHKVELHIAEDKISIF